MNSKQLQQKRQRRVIQGRFELSYKTSDVGRRAAQAEDERVRSIVRRREADEKMARFLVSNGMDGLFR